MTIAKAFLLIALAAGATLRGQSGPVASPQPAPVTEYVLGPDDQIKIWALGIEEIPADKPVAVDPNGDIDLPTLGRVHAGGLTVQEFKAKLVELCAKLVRKPQVSVEISEFGSQPVSVMGAVNKPGVIQLRGRKNLTEVLSMADGLKPEAAPHINISRQIKYGTIPLLGAQPDPSGKFSVAGVNVKELLAGTHPNDNILICPYDTITVPVAEKVIVMGEVHKPGPVALSDRETISVLQALAMAEGPLSLSALQSCTIVRVDPGSATPRQIPVDLRMIMTGKSEDVAMRPNDILVIPPNNNKRMGVKILEAAMQAAVGAAIFRP
jgi:polysaccharide export outer membrane protein